MSAPVYVKAETIGLKGHSHFNERWLQDRIAEDPGILELGDEVELIQRERPQPKSGRLDLLLQDRGTNCRFEVELMLGRTDESHLIRTIEYWDIERRRYPGYDHVAVLVAENVTSRFLNVMSLFSGSIPFIAIQLEAVQIGDVIALVFSRVLDSTSLRQDDSSESISPPRDRGYWIERASAETVRMADDIIKMVDSAHDQGLSATYNKYYIGLYDGIKSNNFVICKPRKKYMHLDIRELDLTEWASDLDDAGIELQDKKGFTRLTMRPEQLDQRRELLQTILAATVALHLDG